jgi:hypothetical protein
MALILDGTLGLTFPSGNTQSNAGILTTGGTLSGAVVVPTLNTPSGVLATQNGMTGIAKAWVTYNAQTQTLINSFNVSSITYNTTGIQTINFTTAMPNANYAVSGSASLRDGTSDGNIGIFSIARCTAYSITTTSCPVQSIYVNPLTIANFALITAIFIGN